MSTLSLAATKRQYEGTAGALLPLGSLVSLHEPLVGRLFSRRAFDVSRCRRILDVGSGAGQILRHLLKFSRPDCQLVAFDLSPQMLRRAHLRSGSDRPQPVAGDVSRMPFATESFDGITCGWVIEHLPDLNSGLNELSRVLKPEGKLLLLATENTWAGAVVGRVWNCRPFDREELRRRCEKVGLTWTREYWLTPLHRILRTGGILVEARKTSGSTERTTTSRIHDRRQAMAATADATRL